MRSNPQPCVLRMRFRAEGETTKYIRAQGVHSRVCFACGYMSGHDSRIPQHSPESIRTSHESLVRSARDEGATYVRAHLTLQVLGRSRDAGKPTTMRHACSLGRARGLPKQSPNKSSVGDTPLSEISKTSVLHMGRHPPSG